MKLMHLPRNIVVVSSSLSPHKLKFLRLQNKQYSPEWYRFHADENIPIRTISCQTATPNFRFRKYKLMLISGPFLSENPALRGSSAQGSGLIRATAFQTRIPIGIAMGRDRERY
jgi:hypothetical protein